MDPKKLTCGYNLTKEDIETHFKPFVPSKATIQAVEAMFERAARICEKEPMDIDNYQFEVMKNAQYPDIGKNPVYPAIGMAGEVGEVMDKIKKIMRDKGGEFSDESRTELAKELGDVLWYAAAFAREIGFSLSEIAEMNLEKCRSRLARNKIHGEGDNR